MPDTAWPVNGHPPGSSRDYPPAPVSMPANLFRHVNGYNARLPDPRLTREPGLLPHRSPRQSSANAAVGGLKPPPAGRLRRANNPSSPAQHHLKKLAYHAPFSVRDTRGSRLSRVDQIDPANCRAVAERRFAPTVMATASSSYTSGACAASPQSDGKPRHYAGTRSRRPLKLAGTADYWLAVVQSQYRAPVFMQFRGHI